MFSQTISSKQFLYKPHKVDLHTRCSQDILNTNVHSEYMFVQAVPLYTEDGPRGSRGHAVHVHVAEAWRWEGESVQTLSLGVGDVHVKE